MALPNLTLRSLSPTVGTNKGSALTFAEMDTNLNNLATANITVTAAGTTTNIALNSGFTITAGSGISLTNNVGNITITSSASGIANVSVDTSPRLGGNLNPNGFSITANIGSTFPTNDIDKAVIRFENTDTRENIASAIAVQGKSSKFMRLGVLNNDPTLVGFGFVPGSNFIEGTVGATSDLHFLNYGNIYTSLGTTINASGIALDGGKQVTIGGQALTSYSNVQVTSYLAGNVTVGNIAGKTSGFTLGYLEMPQVAAANVTLALTDSGKHFYDTSTAPLTVTIPTNASVAFPIGTIISAVNHSTGNLIFDKGSVSLFLGGNATSASRTITSYGVATLMKVDTDTWFINGSGVV